MVRNLLFSDTARGFRSVLPTEMSYKSFLGRPYGPSEEAPMKAIEGVRECPVGDMTLCVTSEAELAKCVRMRTALNAQLLEPKMSCKRASSHLECMRQIAESQADVVVLDAGDVYRAGWTYQLVPIMAEVGSTIEAFKEDKNYVVVHTSYIRYYLMRISLSPPPDVQPEDPALLRRGGGHAEGQLLGADLPEAEEHLPHRCGAGRWLGHPHGLAHRQRAGEGLRVRLGQGGGGVLCKVLRPRGPVGAVPGERGFSSSCPSIHSAVIRDTTHLPVDMTWMRKTHNFIG